MAHSTSRVKLTRDQKIDLMDIVEAALGARKPTLTVKEFAHIVGMHPDTIRKMCMAGEIPAAQRMRNSPYLIFYAELVDFIGRTAA